MADDRTLPDPSPVLDLLSAFRGSKAMFTTMKLGVFDLLQKEPADLPDLAHATACNEDALERLLDTCVGLGLLKKHGVWYSNAPVASTYLTSSSPRRLTGYIRWSNDVMWNLWAHLEDAVREGSHRWNQAYALDGPIFDHFFRTDEEKREFLIGMHGFGLISSPHVVSAFDLSRFSTIVDLGGATGHLAAAACERWPNLRGVVFDLAAAVPLATEYLATTPVADRVEVVAGDFFNDPLPPGDLYALGRIVHDWSREKIDLLIGRIYEALPPGGAVLIAEKVLDEDKRGPRWAQYQNLNMLTCTEGKERTLSEYEEILTLVGFENISCARTTSPLDAILAIKPAEEG